MFVGYCGPAHGQALKLWPTVKSDSHYPSVWDKICTCIETPARAAGTAWVRFAVASLLVDQYEIKSLLSSSSEARTGTTAYMLGCCFQSQPQHFWGHASGEAGLAALLQQQEEAHGAMHRAGAWLPDTAQRSLPQTGPDQGTAWAV